jgi:hypothetical protein
LRPFPPYASPLLAATVSRVPAAAPKAQGKRPPLAATLYDVKV